MTDNPTLESLDAKLSRLIEEWKLVYQEAPNDFLTRWNIADHALAEFVAFHPEMFTMPEPFVIHNNRQLDSILIAQLLNAPSNILEMQTAFDMADRAYQAKMSAHSMDAIDNVFFTAKDGSPRPPSNERERDLAIAWMLNHNAEVVDLGEKRSEALRNLQEAKNRFEAAKLLVQMVCRENRK